MIMKLSELKRIIREVINEDQPLIPKGKWVKASNDALTAFRKELFDIIQKSYANIGGHHDFKSPNDINMQDANFWEYVDVDGNKKPDAVSAAKITQFGKKTVVGATDGSSDGKRALVKHKIVSLHQPGYYAEVSERLADILLDANVPVVNDESEVRKVLNKDIEWIGEIKGKKGDGWYYRNLGGSKHAKIMVGRPKV